MMASEAIQHRPRNPFRSANIRPQANRFLAKPQVQSNENHLEQLVQDLRTHRTCQIVGPHGSGKSTLVAELVHRADQQAMRVNLLAWNGRESTNNWPRWLVWQATPHRANQLYVIDGFEQLPWWARAWTRRRWKNSPAALLVTSHCDAGFFELHRTNVDFSLIEQVVTNILASEHSGWRPAPNRLQQLAEHHGTNVREILFALHDDFHESLAGN